LPSIDNFIFASTKLGDVAGTRIFCPISGDSGSLVDNTLQLTVISDNNIIVDIVFIIMY
jgi:hypothetical protein